MRLQSDTCEANFSVQQTSRLTLPLKLLPIHHEV